LIRGATCYFWRGFDAALDRHTGIRTVSGLVLSGDSRNFCFAQRRSHTVRVDHGVDPLAILGHGVITLIAFANTINQDLWRDRELIRRCTDR
jgi:hypothetical protein